MEYKNCTIELIQEEYPENPRESFDNFGTMALYHRRYSLADSDAPDIEEAKEIAKNTKDYFCLPVYAHEHGGITISTGAFSCPWDSGCIGIIYVSKQKVREEWKVKRISPKLRAIALSNLEIEVKIFDQYLTGDVWIYVIKDETGEEIHSCGGFYGSADAEEQAKSAIDSWRSEHPYQYVNDLFTGEKELPATAAAAL